jgi:hypothetical protein
MAGLHGPYTGILWLSTFRSRSCDSFYWSTGVSVVIYNVNVFESGATTLKPTITHTTVEKNKEVVKMWNDTKLWLR